MFSILFPHSSCSPNVFQFPEVHFAAVEDPGPARAVSGPGPGMAAPPAEHAHAMLMLPQVLY
jgi:hypothetical protein